jgi:ubiquinone/menaquinone biosynthesis C-methylase UbiE
MVRILAPSRKGAHVTGIDTSEAMLEAARQRAARVGASVEWRRSSAESLPFGSRTFDRVLAVTLLCFMKEPLQVMHEVARVLRPDGTFVVGELGRYSSWALRRKLRGRLGSSQWRGGHFSSLDELQRLLEQGEFRVTASRACVYYPPSELAARVVGKHGHVLSCLGQYGAAFLAVRGECS